MEVPEDLAETAESVAETKECFAEMTETVLEMTEAVMSFVIRGNTNQWRETVGCVGCCF